MKHDLALAYLQGGQAQKAIRLLEFLKVQRAKSLSESITSGSIIIHGVDHVSVQRSLARAHRKDQQLEKAIELLEHALQAKTLRETPTSRSMLQYDLALAYKENRHFKRAVELSKS
jgi:tetratricopeptide (TPR) repeat protein